MTQGKPTRTWWRTWQSEEEQHPPGWFWLKKGERRLNQARSFEGTQSGSRTPVVLPRPTEMLWAS